MSREDRRKKNLEYATEQKEKGNIQGKEEQANLAEKVSKRASELQNNTSNGNYSWRTFGKDLKNNGSNLKLGAENASMNTLSYLDKSSKYINNKIGKSDLNVRETRLLDKNADAKAQEKVTGMWNSKLHSKEENEGHFKNSQVVAPSEEELNTIREKGVKGLLEAQSGDVDKKDALQLQQEYKQQIYDEMSKVSKVGEYIDSKVEENEATIQENINNTQSKILRKTAELMPSIAQSAEGMAIGAVNPVLRLYVLYSLSWK